jgi:hypothetical protein
VFVVYGMHHFAARTVGFRPDFCVSCQNEVISVESRSFDVGHIYWLPLIPLGFRRHWRCRTCGQNPRSERTGVVVQGLAAAMFFVVSIITWMEPASADNATFAWAVRIGLPLLGLALLANLRKRKAEDHALRDRLRRLKSVGDACPLCGQRVSAGPERRCTKCGAVEGRAPELAAS